LEKPLSKTSQNESSIVIVPQAAGDRTTPAELAPKADWHGRAESEHVVQFYETDAFLLDSLSGFIRDGLAQQDHCIVVATKTHLTHLEERLASTGLSLTEARERGQFITHDADELLGKLLVEGKIEVRRFTEVVGLQVIQATQNHPRVRIYGELVALLCATGDHREALRLEELWCHLHKKYPFKLYCGYPLNSFAEPGLAESFGKICNTHSRVIPAESYTSLSLADERLRAITVLQQQASSLKFKIKENRDTEALLQDSELRYRRLFDTSVDGILMIDFESRKITEANPSMAEMLGIPASAIIGKELWEIGLLEGLEANLQLWGELEENQLFHNEYLQLTSQEGRHYFIDFICNKFHTKGKQVIQCTVRDITERRGAEEISLHLAAIVESSDDAIISKSLNGTILSWNKGAERIFGYLAEEIIGKSILLLIPPGGLDEEARIIEQLRNGKRIDHYETVRIAKDGSKVDISLSVSPIRDKAGNIIAASKVARNITDRKRAERNLREQAEIIETINLIGQRLSADLHLQNVIQTVTQASTEITGALVGAFFYNIEDEEREAEKLYTFSGISGKVFEASPLPANLDLFAPTGQKLESLRIDNVRGDERFDRRSPFFHTAENHFSIASYLAVPVISSSGQLHGSLYFAHQEAGIFSERHQRIVEGIAAQAAIALDNAKLYELALQERAKAEEANRLKDEFLATVSHELRTPLNAIIGWAHMLNRGRLNENSVAHALETIERNARSQAQLIEDILDVSRIITGKLRLKVEAFDIVTVISAAIDSVQLAADAKAITLNVIIDPSARHISGDASRLQQVIWNLLSNAIKFTDHGGRVDIRLEQVNGTAQLAVKDSGMGISAAFLPFIFERFRQADGTTTRNHGGLGLGLAIVRHLVELHGGTVRAESEGEGFGTTFTINLPLYPYASRANTHTAQAGSYSQSKDPSGRVESMPSLAGLKVLVVDDDPDTLTMLKAMLSDSGAEVQAVASAAQALESLQVSTPDVLVSDLAMPQEDGFSLIGRIRNSEVPKAQKIPAVALTAYVRVEDRARALTAGFNMFVPKPIEPIELITAIANLATAAVL
jgi:PAS domain S-box-containing protein